MKVQVWRVLAAALVFGQASAVLAGTNVWTETGPEASDVKVRFSSDPDIAYARGGDKLWKSTNGGRDWVQLFNKNASLSPFAVDPSDPDIVIVGHGFFNDGLLRSADGGATFSYSGYGHYTSVDFSADGSVAYR